ncbi:outer membrane efflux protein [Prevotella sp. DNF00663]|uniref:TolC family protein n=1 Tax=unclassified Prevotella TaxID=2638335 RepID=UPI000512A5A9|nr:MULTISPECIES: TolC family protein [unclassified Prevotella]KGI61005.1 membrane protein [Prevotella sp. S7 MS 2]KXB83978.1 outer membrane efflux protein [Prevotella sp. DNF00663]
MRRLFLLLLTTICQYVAAADTLQLSLPDAIAMARRQSLDAAVARNSLLAAYWEYRAYRADMLPELSLVGTLPQFNQSYSAYQQADGTYKYVRNETTSLASALNIKQNIWLTGGRLSLTSSLDYIHDTNNRNFMSVPLSLTLEQPLFGVNHHKWHRRIEPVKYNEAKAAFISATEEVTMKTIQYFFDLLLANENVNIARQNKENAQRLYDIARERRRMGHVSESDVMQLKLSLLKAEATLARAESSKNSSLFRLRAFLDMPDSADLQVVSPPQQVLTGTPQLAYVDVLDKALTRNSFVQSIRRSQLEADYAVAQARGNLRDISLNVTMGWSGIANDRLQNAYRDLRDNAIVRVGVAIPLLDWGKRRGTLRMAESNRKVTESRLRQQQQAFNQNIFLLVENFNNQRRQLSIAVEADSIARRRYQTSIETFVMGKINTLDLNDAQIRKDEARQQYINETYLFWHYYYQLRSLTLWDFSTNNSIDADFEAIICEKP